MCRVGSNRERSGTDGAAGYLELRRDVPTDGSSLVGMQMFMFYDLAAAWNRDPVSGTYQSSIASGGLGVRLALPGRINAEVELAKPLTAPVSGDNGLENDVRAFFGLSTSF